MENHWAGCGVTDLTNGCKCRVPERGGLCEKCGVLWMLDEYGTLRRVAPLAAVPGSRVDDLRYLIACSQGSPAATAIDELERLIAQPRRKYVDASLVREVFTVLRKEEQGCG